MTIFTVVLERLLNGSSAGTTEDEIEAASAGDAEAQAIAAWKAVAPRYAFRPLFTRQHGPAL